MMQTQRHGLYTADVGQNLNLKNKERRMEKIYRCEQCIDEPCTLFYKTGISKPKLCPFFTKDEGFEPSWIEVNIKYVPKED